MNTRISMDIGRDWKFSPWPEPDDDGDEEDSWESEGMSISTTPHQPVIEL